ncbi:MAG: PIN domain-containing protein [Acidobacteriota bacterium]
MQRLFVDTSVWFAYVNRRDPDHASVCELIRSFEGRLMTSNYVFDETVTLCRMRLGHPIGQRVGTVLRDPSSVEQIRLTVADEMAAWILFKERSDKHYSFTDCTSFVLLRRLRLVRVAALDADFRREGFTLLPEP